MEQNDLRKVSELVELELVGLDGNVFSLMGAFQQAARRQGVPKEEIKSVLDECTTGDYDHAIVTLMANTESPEGEDDYEDEE